MAAPAVTVAAPIDDRPPRLVVKALHLSAPQLKYQQDRGVSSEGRSFYKDAAPRVRYGAVFLDRKKTGLARMDRARTDAPRPAGPAGRGRGAGRPARNALRRFEVLTENVPRRTPTRRAWPLASSTPLHPTAAPRPGRGSRPRGARRNSKIPRRPSTSSRARWPSRARSTTRARRAGRFGGSQRRAADGPRRRVRGDAAAPTVIVCQGRTVAPPPPSRGGSRRRRGVPRGYSEGPGRRRERSRRSARG